MRGGFALGRVKICSGYEIAICAGAGRLFIVRQVFSGSKEKFWGANF